MQVGPVCQGWTPDGPEAVGTLVGHQLRVDPPSLRTCRVSPGADEPDAECLA
jgi:hypothetical protein